MTEITKLPDKECAYRLDREQTSEIPPRDEDQIEIAGLGFNNFSEAECVQHVVHSALEGRGGWVVTPNADIARLCNQNPDLKQLIRGATVTVADGMPIIWASKISGKALKERVCGSNLAWSIAEAAAANNLSVFLLGGGLPDTATRAADILQLRHPDLKIAGTHYPPFGFEKDPAEIRQIKNSIERSEPDIVFVALSFPKGERLISALREIYPTTWWIGIGISLSFICGEVRRAPTWMQVTGLEWLYRLSQEPKRLVSRYLRDDMPFVFGLLYQSLGQRYRTRGQLNR